MYVREIVTCPFFMNSAACNGKTQHPENCMRNALFPDDAGNISNPSNTQPQNSMKITQPKYSVFAISAALALASFVGINSARADYYYNTFDTSASLPDGTGGGLAATSTNGWDGSVNGPNEPDSPSGSMYFSAPFTSASGWQELQLNLTVPSGSLDIGSYLNVEFDLKVDTTNSYAAADGTYGAIYPVIQQWSPGNVWGQLPGQVIAGTNGWQHFKFSLASAPTPMNRLVLDLNNGGSAVTNTCKYWIDDIVFTQPPLPAPTLMSPIPTPRHAGLTFMPAGGNQYQRVMVYPNPSTEGTAFGWYGAGAPVSYSITITNFPQITNYTAQIFWIPNNAMVYGPNDTSVDWNCTNDLIFTVSANQTNASEWGVTMAAKTNSPGALGAGNPNVTITNFAWNTLPVGTWTITFNNDTDFTITTPSNTTVSASLPADVANIVSGNALGSTADTVYFGIQPNSPGGIGLPCVFDNISISGVANPINDSFNTGVLDTNIWTTLTDVPGDIMVNPGNWAWYLRWNTPNDQGYSVLQGASSVTGPWQDLEPVSNWLLVNGTRYATVTTNDLATLGGSGAAYFRLLKRTFTQLQVLWPGQTNAPGTVNGYVGTPAPQSISAGGGVALVPVTINACDSSWHIVNASDTISVTSSDGTAIDPSPASLVHGTVQETIGFVSPGTPTVTATDTSNTNIPPVTSVPITINN